MSPSSSSCERPGIRNRGSGASDRRCGALSPASAGSRCAAPRRAAAAASGAHRRVAACRDRRRTPRRRVRSRRARQGHAIQSRRGQIPRSRRGRSRRERRGRSPRSRRVRPRRGRRRAPTSACCGRAAERGCSGARRAACRGMQIHANLGRDGWGALLCTGNVGLHDAHAPIDECRDSSPIYRLPSPTDPARPRTRPSCGWGAATWRPRATIRPSGAGDVRPGCARDAWPKLRLGLRHGCLVGPVSGARGLKRPAPRRYALRRRCRRRGCWPAPARPARV